MLPGRYRGIGLGCGRSWRFALVREVYGVSVEKVGRIYCFIYFRLCGVKKNMYENKSNCVMQTQRLAPDAHNVVSEGITCVGGTEPYML